MRALCGGVIAAVEREVGHTNARLRVDVAGQRTLRKLPRNAARSEGLAVDSHLAGTVGLLRSNPRVMFAGAVNLLLEAVREIHRVSSRAPVALFGCPHEDPHEDPPRRCTATSDLWLRGAPPGFEPGTCGL
jgi:hypothetical protein